MSRAFCERRITENIKGVKCVCRGETPCLKEWEVSCSLEQPGSLRGVQEEVRRARRLTCALRCLTSPHGKGIWGSEASTLPLVCTIVYSIENQMSLLPEGGETGKWLFLADKNNPQPYPRFLWSAESMHLQSCNPVWAELRLSHQWVCPLAVLGFF